MTGGRGLTGSGESSSGTGAVESNPKTRRRYWAMDTINAGKIGIRATRSLHNGFSAGCLV
jgi:hypothetical protein